MSSIRTVTPRAALARFSHRHEVARRVTHCVLLPGLLLYLAMVGVGLLLTYPLAEIASGESEVNRDLAAQRTSGWTTVSDIVSTSADTPVIIATVFVFALVLRWVYRGWRQAATLVTAVLLQAGIFLFTTMVIDRPRPPVPPLDVSPPTSSFPSGHTGASTALYLTLALVIGWQLRRRLFRVSVTLLLVIVPLAVGASRLYRGMHHPSDIIFGALNGLACLAIAAWAFRTYPGGDAAPSASPALR